MRATLRGAAAAHKEIYDQSFGYDGISDSPHSLCSHLLLASRRARHTFSPLYG
jgi:hypothetical protein